MRHDDPNLPYLRSVAEALGELRKQVVFVGGAVAAAFTPLLTNADFLNVLPGLLVEPERAGLVLARLKEMSQQ